MHIHQNATGIAPRFQGHGFDNASAIAPGDRPQIPAGQVPQDSFQRHGGNDQELSPRIVEGYVGKQIRNSLPGQGAGTTAAQGYASEDHSPKATAKRILAAVEKGISGAATPEERAALLDKARQGIEQGFADARDVLTGMGALQGKLERNIDKTYDRVMKGLDRLEKSPGAVDESKGPKSAEGAQAMLAVAGTCQAESGSLSLIVKTAEGDAVTVRLSHESYSEQTAYAAKGPGFKAAGSSASAYSKDAISYSVEGDLSDAELKAIGALTKDIGQLANRFFDGDVKSAFEQATDLGFDNKQLAGFSLELSHTVTRSAVAAYQTVSQATGAPEDKAPAAPVPASPVTTAVAAIADLRDVYQSAAKRGKLENPKQAVGDLFEGFGQMRGWLDAGDKFMDRIRELLSRFGEPGDSANEGTATPTVADNKVG
jgi:hypothetical protein